MSNLQDVYGPGDFNIDISEQINQVVREVASDLCVHFGCRGATADTDETFDPDALWISAAEDTDGGTIGKQFSLSAEFLAPRVWEQSHRVALAAHLDSIAARLRVPE